jgi:hypothetical protein
MSTYVLGETAIALVGAAVVFDYMRSREVIKVKHAPLASYNRTESGTMSYADTMSAPFSARMWAETTRDYNFDDHGQIAFDTVLGPVHSGFDPRFRAPIGLYQSGVANKNQQRKAKMARDWNAPGSDNWDYWNRAMPRL